MSCVELGGLCELLSVCVKMVSLLREAIAAKKSQNCGLFPYGGGGGTTPFQTFWGGFPLVFLVCLAFFWFSLNVFGFS